jgi:hypothetical protein
MHKVIKVIKETSGLAILSFFLAFLPFFIIFLSPLIPPEISNVLGCGTEYWIPQTAIFSGILALIYIRRKKVKGKLLAILGITLGVLGIFLFICI